MMKSFTLLMLLGLVLLTACQSEASRTSAQPSAQPTSTAAPETLESTSDAALEATAETTHEAASEVTTEATAEATAQVTTAATREVTPDAASAESSPEVLLGDAARGETLFTTRPREDVPSCSSCHTTVRGGMSRGGAPAPSLIGVANRAGRRIEGLSAEEYLYQSIVTPRIYLVDGFADNMYTRYANVYSEQELADLVAFLMTLE